MVHNQEVGGSNPSPATKKKNLARVFVSVIRCNEVDEKHTCNRGQDLATEVIVIFPIPIAQELRDRPIDTKETPPLAGFFKSEQSFLVVVR